MGRLLFIPLLICYANLLHAEVTYFHTLTLGHERSSQSVELGSLQQRLRPSGHFFQYQLAQQTWALNFSHNNTQDKTADSITITPRRDTIHYQGEGYSAFLDFYEETFWYALGISEYTDHTLYDLANADFFILNDHHIQSRTYSLDLGRRFDFSHANVDGTMSLSRQNIDESIQYDLKRRGAIQDNGLQESSQHTHVDESGWLGAMSIRISKVFAFSQQWQITPSLALSYITGLRGETLIRQQQRFRGPNSDGSSASEELGQQSSNSSTRLSSAIVLANELGHVNLSLGRLSQQKWRHGHLSVSASLYL